MLGYTPPQPKFWKALVTVAPIVALVTWTIPLFHLHMPSWLLMGAAVVAWIAISGAVHSRVSNDWRGEYGMNLTITEHRSSVARNVRFGKR